MPLLVGDCFYLQTRPDKPPHWCFVIGLDPEKDRLYIVKMTTVRANTHTSKLTCILEPGDHVMTIDRSFISYEYGEFVRLTMIEDEIERRIIPTTDPASPGLLNRILDGVNQSKLFDGQIKNRLRQLYPTIFPS